MSKGNFNPDNPDLKGKIVHKSGSAGGMLVGKRHSSGGIKAINKSTGQPLEMEGGEVVITRNAVSDKTKRSFNGKMMTNREILSAINVSGGGVSFADGGEIPEDFEIEVEQGEYEFGGKTVDADHLLYEMSKCGCEHTEDKPDSKDEKNTITFADGGVLNDPIARLDEIIRDNEDGVADLFQSYHPKVQYMVFENEKISIKINSYKEFLAFFRTIRSNNFNKMEMRTAVNAEKAVVISWNNISGNWNYDALLLYNPVGSVNNGLSFFLKTIIKTIPYAKNYDWTEFIKADTNPSDWFWCIDVTSVLSTTANETMEKYPKLFSTVNPMLQCAGFISLGERQAVETMSSLIIKLDELTEPRRVAYIYVENERVVWGFRTVDGSKRNTSKQINIDNYYQMSEAEKVDRFFKYIKKSYWANLVNWEKFLKGNYLKIKPEQRKYIFKNHPNYTVAPDSLVSNNLTSTSEQSQNTEETNEVFKDISTVYEKDFTIGQIYFLDNDTVNIWRVFKTSSDKVFFVNIVSGQLKLWQEVSNFSLLDQQLIRKNDTIILDTDETQLKVEKVERINGEFIYTVRAKDGDAFKTNGRRVRYVLPLIKRGALLAKRNGYEYSTINLWNITDVKFSGNTPRTTTVEITAQSGNSTETFSNSQPWNRASNDFMILRPLNYETINNNETETNSEPQKTDTPKQFEVVRIGARIYKVTNVKNDGSWDGINLVNGSPRNFTKGQPYQLMPSKVVPKKYDTIKFAGGDDKVERVYFQNNVLKMELDSGKVYNVDSWVDFGIKYRLEANDLFYEYIPVDNVYKTYKVKSIIKSSWKGNEYTLEDLTSDRKVTITDDEIDVEKDFYIKSDPRPIEFNSDAEDSAYSTITNEALVNINNAMSESFKLSKNEYELTLKFINELIAEKQIQLQLDPIEYEGSLRLDLLNELKELQQQKYKIYFTQQGGEIGVIYRILERLHKGEVYEEKDGVQVIGNNVFDKDVIYTEKFKKWFGDWERAIKKGNNEGVSKAVDKNGMPQIYYNGSARRKYSYRQTSNGVFYLAENRSYALWFAQNAQSPNAEGKYLMETFVDIKNPIDLTPFKTDQYDFAEIVRYIATFYPSSNIYDFLPSKIKAPILEGNMTKFKIRAWQLIRQYPKLNRHIRLNTQYDGYFYMENNPSDIINGKENITKACAIFNSNQVKLKNATMFNPILDDFRFELGGKLKTNQHDR